MPDVGSTIHKLAERQNGRNICCNNQVSHYYTMFMSYESEV